MDDVVSTFPLLRLPKDAILNTMRISTHLEIFGVSILSKKTKNLVGSLKLTATDFSVYFFDSFFVLLSFPNICQLYFRLYRVRENERIQELETPGNIGISNGNEWVTWKNVMSVKELLDHLQCIFHISINTLYFGPHCERFSFESIQRNVRDFQSICFPFENHEQHRRILRFFQPAKLAILENALVNGHVPRYISTQNFDVIAVDGVQITLDDLLVNNAWSIHITCDRLSIRILNRFLKLWAKGSNSRLEFLFLRFRQADFQANELLKRLKYQDAPSNRRRLFKASGQKEPQEVIGGWDIWRFDGTQATISVIIVFDFAYFDLYVWHDHCIVN